MSDENRDQDLVRRARAGEVRAMESLLDLHQGTVLRILAGLGVPPADREDVAQEIFIRVFRHLPKIRDGRVFSAWLYRIAINTVHNYRGSRATRIAREESWREGLEDVRDPDPGPESRANHRALARKLEQAMERMSRRERAVFVLRELEGLETGEIASALGITRITVRRHLGLARRRIREFLDP